MDASLLGQFDLVSQLLSDVAEINLRDNEGWTALHYAVAAGHTDIVELLLTRGAHVNSTTKKNESCLLLAALNGCSDVVRVLVSAGADVNLQRSDGVSPLHAVSHRYTDFVKIMLHRIAQVDTGANNGETPLVSGEQDPDRFQLADSAYIHSVKNEHESSVLRYGFKVLTSLARAFVSAVEAQLDDGIAQLHAGEFIGILKQFLKDSHVSTEDKYYGAIPLLCALLSRYGDVLRLHVEMTNRDADVKSISSSAVAHDVLDDVSCGDTDRACWLLSASGDDVNFQSNDSRFPFHEAIQRGFMYVDTAKLLLDNDAKIETRDIEGFTPLLSAAERGHADVVKLLLDKGADIKSLTYANESCLVIAARNGHTNVVRVLVSAGVDVDLQHSDGVSPLHAASREGHTEVLKVLLENGANVDAADARGNRPLHTCHGLDVVQLLVQHGAKLNVQNNNGETPLHIAVRRQQSDVIMFLLSQDADVGLADVVRNSPLHYVTSELLKRDGLAKYVTKKLTIKLTNPVIRNAIGLSAIEHNIAHGLLDYQCDTGDSQSYTKMYVDCYGNTPLHHVVGMYEELGMFVRVGDVSKVVEFLVKHDADINAQNNDGHTPLHVAREPEAVQACLRYADDRSFTIKDKQGRNFWHLLFLQWTEEDSVTTSDIGLSWHTIRKSRAIHSCDNLRRTPLHYACMRLAIERTEFLAYFINSLSSEHINKQDKFGRTALHYAAIGGHSTLMNFLKWKKADVNTKDNFGKTATEYLAMQHEHPMDDIGLRCSLVVPSEARDFVQSVALRQCSEEELRIQIHNLRRSVYASSFVRNMYLECRFDYSDKFDRAPQSVKDCLYERVIKPTAESAARSNINMFAAIHSRVSKAMAYLANEISSEDDRFACEVFPVGSAHEGTKIGRCDEFDYNFALTNLSKMCKVCSSPESPPGFVLLKASATDYDEDLFDNNGTLNTRIVKFKFEALAKRILSSSQFYEVTDFDFIHPEQGPDLSRVNFPTKPHTAINLAFTQPVNGSHVLHQISIDIVPALQIDDWWPDNARQDLCQTGECFIVFAQPQKKYPWIGWTEPHGLISFARAESRLLRQCPQVVKAAYMVVKHMSRRMSCCFSSLEHVFSSYVIKTALLWSMDDDDFSNFSSDNSDDVNEDELLHLVQKILRRLLCFAAQDYVPSYFMPTCHQPVWLKEKHLKEFHMRVYQHGLTYKDLIRLNKQELAADEMLQDIKSMFISSHIMYWIVLSDADELELFVPSSINPLRDISYQHLPTSLRRQLTTEEVYSRTFH